MYTFTRPFDPLQSTQAWRGRFFLGFAILNSLVSLSLNRALTSYFLRGVRTTILKVLLILQALIFNIAFGILGLVVAAEYANAPPPCAQLAEFLFLNKWLLGFGIANVVIGAITIPFTIAMEGLGSTYEIWTAVASMFSFAWMIVGSVVLYRDCFPCETEAFRLWQVSMACLISYYINFAVGFVIAILKCCCLKESKNS